MNLYEKLKNIKNFPEFKYNVNYEEDNYEAGYNYCLREIIDFLKTINN